MTPWYRAYFLPRPTGRSKSKSKSRTKTTSRTKSTRPAGKAPMPCYKIDQHSFGRKSAKAIQKQRTKACRQRATHPYIGYRCKLTEHGCKGFGRNGRTKSRSTTYGRGRSLTPSSYNGTPSSSPLGSPLINTRRRRTR